MACLTSMPLTSTGLDIRLNAIHSAISLVAQPVLSALGWIFVLFVSSSSPYSSLHFQFLLTTYMWATGSIPHLFLDYLKNFENIEKIECSLGLIIKSVEILLSMLYMMSFSLLCLVYGAESLLNRPHHSTQADFILSIWGVFFGFMSFGLVCHFFGNLWNQ